MKRTLNVFWIISAVFLALAGAWGVITGLSGVMNPTTVCGVSLVIFGVVSILAAFTVGLKIKGSGWLVFDGIISFVCGLACIFWYVDASLFMVDMIYIMGIWLMMLGISQSSRASFLGKASFGKILMTALGVLGVLCGMSWFVRPLYILIPFSEYGMSFMLGVSAVMVICRCLAKQTKKG